MNLLFILKSAGHLHHFAGVIGALLERGHRVRVAVNTKRVPPEFEAILRRLAAQGEGFSSCFAEGERFFLWGELNRSLRMAYDYLRYHEPRFREAYSLRERAEGYAPRYMRALGRMGLLKRAGARGRAAALFRSLEQAIPVDPDALRLIAEARPDVVLISPLVDFASDQVEYVKASRALGVPSALCVASWDNLSNKGLLRVIPDYITVWNELQRREAAEFQGADPSRVFVTGAQTFDDWFRWRPSCTREEFCGRLGLSSGVPLLLYLCSSASIARDEPSFVKQWIGWVRTSGGPHLREAAVLIRPHPKNAAGWRDFEARSFPNVAVFPRRGAFVAGDDRAKDDYYNSLYYSSAVVGLNTTAMVEAAILGRPVLTPVLPGVEETRRGTVGTLHFRYLASPEGGFVQLAHSVEEHLAQLEAALLDPGRAREKAEEFVRAFVRPHGRDVPATQKLAEAIEAMGAARRAPLAAPAPHPRPTKALLPLLALPALFLFLRGNCRGLARRMKWLAIQGLWALGKSLRRGARKALRWARRLKGLAWKGLGALDRSLGRGASLARRVVHSGMVSIPQTASQGEEGLGRWVEGPRPEDLPSRGGAPLSQEESPGEKPWGAVFRRLAEGGKQVLGGAGAVLRVVLRGAGKALWRVAQGVLGAAPFGGKRKGLEMNRYWFRLPGFRLLVAHIPTMQYGHAGYELLMALRAAREARAALYVLRGRSPANEDLFRLTSPEVRVLGPTRARDLLFRILIALPYFWRQAPISLRRRLGLYFQRLKEELRSAELAGRTGFPLLVKKRVLGAILRRKKAAPGASYMRRKVVNDGLPVRIRPSDLGAAERAARQLGVASDAPLVCVHVREAAYKEGRNAEDKGLRRHDSTRNARVETYFEAMDYMVGLGYTVIRVGDPLMAPLRRPGVVDLATSPLRTGMLELYFLSRCAFLLGSESGPYHVTYLFGTPSLIANATDPIGSYPVRRNDLYLLKRVRVKETGEVLSLSRMLTEEYYGYFRDIERFEYLDNSSDEIAAAVREMFEGLKGGPCPSAAQREYATLAHRAAQALSPKVPYIRKWGPEGDFLGEGWVCRGFAERYLYGGGDGV